MPAQPMKKAKGKLYGKVTSLTFPDTIHIDGQPYDVTPVKRFLEKGGGIHLRDGVIYSVKKEGQTLSFLMNEKYACEHGYVVSGGIVFVVDPSSHSPNEPATQDEIDELNRLEKIAKEGEFVPIDQVEAELFGKSHLHITLDTGQQKKFGLECTIPVEKYQFVKPSVAGCDCAEECVADMLNFLNLLGNKDEITKSFIDHYQNKVLDGYLEGAIPDGTPAPPK